MKQRFHGRKALLNLPGFHGTAAISCEVEDTSTWEEGKSRSGLPLKEVSTYDIEPNYNFSISDCTRSIDLDIDFEFPENALHKIDTMVDCLLDFRAGVKKEQKRFKKRRKKLKKKNKYQ